MLGESVQGLLDIVGTVDTAFSEYSATLLIQSNVNKVSAEPGGDD